MIKVEGIYAPFLFRAPISQELYVICGGIWTPVPEGTTLDQIQWKDTRSKYTSKSNQADISVKVKASKGNIYYKVESRANQWSCTCTGFGFRRKCKHVEQVKQKYENNYDKN